MTMAHGLDVDDLRVLCAVADHGSFTAAAGALHYTQSGVSRRVASLERATGADLFTRQARGVRLTAAGQALHRHALDVLDRLDALAAEMTALRQGSGGRLRVGSFVTANTALVPQALRRFGRAHPDVHVTVAEALSGHLVEEVRRGGLDLAVVSDYPTGAPPATDVDLTPLCRDPLLVALPRRHRLAGEEAVSLVDLAGERWIEAGRGGPPSVLVAACARAGFVPRADIAVASWTAKLGFVAAGLGVTLVPRLAVAALRRDLVLRPVTDDLPARRVWAAAPGAGALAAAGNLTALLQAEAAALVGS
jgi:DNA-binding transcriptional LysR family regulator